MFLDIAMFAMLAVREHVLYKTVIVPVVVYGCGTYCLTWTEGV
jgi:hypothetical protein